MKRGLLLTAIFLSLILLLLLILPYLVEVEEIQTHLAQKIREKTGYDLTVEGASWQWLPHPAVVFTAPEIEGEGFGAKAAALRLYPDLEFLVKGRVITAAIHIDSPQVSIHLPERKKAAEKKGGGESHSKEAPPLPEERERRPVLSPALFRLSKITLTNGRLRLYGREGGNSRQLADIAISAGSVKQGRPGADLLQYSIEGRSQFVRSFSLLGKFRLSSREFQATGVVAQFQLSRLLSIMGVKSRPSKAVINMVFDASGQGDKILNAEIKGDVPCLIVRSGQKESHPSTPLACSSFHLSLNKDEAGWELEVKGLEMAAPALKGLQGHVAYRHEGSWMEMDLAGEGLDLSSLRRTLLELLPSSKNLTKVTNIVLAGQATRFSFKFSGPRSDLSHLQALDIGIDVEDGEVMIPGVELHLEDLAGPIAIKKGILTGEGLKGRLGKSEIFDAALRLGLHGPDPPFVLSLRTKAMLEDLYPLLKRTVHNRTFQSELDKISNYVGWVLGSFQIGPRLHHNRFTAEIKSLDVSAGYDRLAAPISITGGVVKIGNRSVTFKNVAGTVGRSRVTGLSGSVKWDGNATIEISSLQGLVDMEELLTLLRHYKSLRGRLEKIAASANGTSSILAGSLSGPLKRPPEWHYTLRIRPRAVIHTPLLPFPLHAIKGEIEITPDVVHVVKAGPVAGDAGLSITGRFFHRSWHHWSGDFEMNGTLGGTVLEWIGNKGWIPERYFPALAAEAKGLCVTWGQGKASIKGAILAPKGSVSRSRAEIDVTVSNDLIAVHRLSIVGQANHMELALKFRKRAPRMLDIAVKGETDGDAVSSLLRRNDLLHGGLKGDFALHLEEHGDKAWAKGNLKIRDALWHWGLRLPVSIKAMDLQTADDGSIALRGEAVVGGEEFSVSGKALPRRYGFTLDATISSPRLTWQNLEQLFAKEEAPPSIQGAEATEETVETQDHPEPPPFFTGTLHLNAKNFLYHRLFKGDEKQEYLFTPLRASVFISEDKEMRFEIGHAELCGLSINGKWDARAEHGVFNLFTDTPRPFRDTLACLHEDTTVIDGNFTATLNLAGRPGAWSGGEFQLASRNGRILKMGLLSKVLSVVNIGDFLTGQNMEGFFKKGFPYSELETQGMISDNRLSFTKGVVKGAGLNLFWKGDVGLSDYDSDIVMFVAPFKTVDAIITKVPILGRLVTGNNNEAFISLPVRIKGPLKEPEISVMPPGTVGKELLRWVGSVVTFPFKPLGELEEKANKNRDSGGGADGQ